MNISRLRESPVKENKTNDSTAKIGMNFEYIAINVRNTTFTRYSVILDDM
jgi:hypothetical protein